MSTTDLAERFEAFHLANPQVYEALRTLAFKAIDAGHTKLGIAQLFEVCRWELLLASTDRAPHLNNDYRAGYARLLMEREPRLQGAFNLRSSRIDQSSPGHSPEPSPTADPVNVAAGSGQPAATPLSPSESAAALFDVAPDGCGPAWADDRNPYSDRRAA